MFWPLGSKHWVTQCLPNTTSIRSPWRHTNSLILDSEGAPVGLDTWDTQAALILRCNFILFFNLALKQAAWLQCFCDDAPAWEDRGRWGWTGPWDCPADCRWTVHPVTAHPPSCQRQTARHSWETSKTWQKHKTAFFGLRAPHDTGSARCSPPPHPWTTHVSDSSARLT